MNCHPMVSPRKIQPNSAANRGVTKPANEMKVVEYNDSK